MAKVSQKKRQRMMRERAQETAVSDHLSGEGDASCGDSAFREQRLIQRAVRNGWLQPGEMQRFETRTAQRELLERINSDPGEASGMELASLAVIDGLNSQNERVRGIAARTLLQMERANQRDDELRAMQEMRAQADGTGEVKALDWDSMYEPQANAAARALRELESTND